MDMHTKPVPGGIKVMHHTCCCACMLLACMHAWHDWSFAQWWVYHKCVTNPVQAQPTNSTASLLQLWQPCCQRALAGLPN